MTPTTIWRAGANAVVSIGAALLIVASAALGTYFGFQTGSHYHPLLGLIFAGAGLGGELLKPFAMHAAFRCARTLEPAAGGRLPGRGPRLRRVLARKRARPLGR